MSHEIVFGFAVLFAINKMLNSYSNKKLMFPLPLNFLVAVLILTHAFAAIPSLIGPYILFDLIARSSAVWLSVLPVIDERFSAVCIPVLEFFRDALTAYYEHFLVAVVFYLIPGMKNIFLQNLL